MLAVPAALLVQLPQAAVAVLQVIPALVAKVLLADLVHR
jgi:hypothetical protein